MGITRKLPDSDETRNLALSAAKTKKDSAPPTGIVLTPTTITRLDAMQPMYFSNMLARRKALAEQSTLTASVNAAKASAKMFISHFIHVFNFGVRRKVYPASDRAFYQLNVNSNTLPRLVTEAEIIAWGTHIADGDAMRIATGGAAMSNPTAAEVAAHANDFETKNITQSTLKDAYDIAQEAVSNSNPDADKLILRIWDEVETAFNDEPSASKRRKAREWGVVYVSAHTITISGVVKNAPANVPLAGTLLRITSSNEQTLSKTNGRYELKTRSSNIEIVECSVPGFITQQRTIDLTEGKSISDVDFMMQPVAV